MTDTTKHEDSLQDRVTDALILYFIRQGFLPSTATRADVDVELLVGVLAGLRAPGCLFSPETVGVLCGAVERRLIRVATEDDLAHIVALNEATAKTDATTSAPVDIEGTFIAIAKALSPEQPHAIEFSVSRNESGTDWRLSLRTRPREASDAVGHGMTFVAALRDLAQAASVASRKNANVLAERAEAQRNATEALEAVTGAR